MKLKIKCIQNPLWLQDVWQVSFNSTVANFNNPEAAFDYGRKTYKRYYKEQAAFSMLQTIAVNLLCIRDKEFIDKLLKTKCKGISKSQYGYLKGIHERQVREW